MESINSNIDFSRYRNVFCDSREALEWAYQRGLPNDAIIRTSSPAMLWNKDPNIIHIESRWNADSMKAFQTTIQKFSEQIYDNVMLIEGVAREESLCVAQLAVSFHQLLFKAACLTKEDLVESRLFVSVDGDSGPRGNKMNPPWDKLLTNNLKFRSIPYELKSDKWGGLTTEGVSFWHRMRIGGWETLIYRFLTKLPSVLLPGAFFRGQVLVVGENELLIETTASLALNRVRIRQIKATKGKAISINKGQLLIIKKSIQPIVNQRIKNWVEPSLVGRCEELFFLEVEEKLNNFMEFRTKWEFLIKESKRHKSVLLINSPGNIKGLALAAVCRKAEIPIVAFQHGVTHEICATHGEVSVNYEINYSDIFIAYNHQSAKTSQTSHFIKGTSFVAGISARHLRMVNPYLSANSDAPPIVYVSTNLYRGNMSNINTWETDYGRAISEGLLITNVFSRLPYKVSYKTYPEETRRYADNDPVFAEVFAQENLYLFDRKIDMRFLLSRYRILITSVATSTLSWLILSGKPVVFINQSCNGPLTESAHSIFSEGLFLFDDTKGFHERLRDFLSLPIDEIEGLWKQKESARKGMVNQFFSSSYSNNAGQVAAKMMFNKYFKY